MIEVATADPNGNEPPRRSIRLGPDVTEKENSSMYPWSRKLSVIVVISMFGSVPKGQEL